MSQDNKALLNQQPTRRLRTISSHLLSECCSSFLPSYKFDRIPLKIFFNEDISYERYSSKGVVVLEGDYFKPKTVSKSIIIFMHPMGILNTLPLPTALARSGLHVITCASRYPNNDSALIMEKVLIDLGACVRYSKEKLGYEKVILGGWSGGGSLSAYYQSQAENPNVLSTPLGDPPNLTKESLIPADAVLQIAAHASRARTLTEWLDPSIIDENDLSKKDKELDLYDPSNPNKPPYTQEYIKRYREAQITRNRRITQWVLNEFAKIKGNEYAEKCFVVNGTMADPRWLDLAQDPNDRKGPNWCYLGEPKIVNNTPSGLGRFCTLRSWMSQWSYDFSNADGPRNLSRVSVPVLIVENSGDDAVPVPHIHDLYAAVKHDRKELITIKGANHYYIGQKELQNEACTKIINWLVKYKLIEESFKISVN